MGQALMNEDVAAVKRGYEQRDPIPAPEPEPAVEEDMSPDSRHRAESMAAIQLADDVAHSSFAEVMEEISPHTRARGMSLFDEVQDEGLHGTLSRAMPDLDALLDQAEEAAATYVPAHSLEVGMTELITEERLQAGGDIPAWMTLPPGPEREQRRKQLIEIRRAEARQAEVKEEEERLMAAKEAAARG